MRKPFRGPSLPLLKKNIVPEFRIPEAEVLLLAGFWDVMSTYMHYIFVTFFVREILDGIAVWFLLCYSVGCLWSRTMVQNKANDEKLIRNCFAIMKARTKSCTAGNHTAIPSGTVKYLAAAGNHS